MAEPAEYFQSPAVRFSRWLTRLEETRPGAHRTEALPLLSPHIACGIAFVIYPLVIITVQGLLHSRSYNTDAPWLRYIGAVHNAALGVFSLGMWLSVFYTLGTDTTYDSAVEFFCLPAGEPAMPPRLSLFPYLFYLSKIYELLDTVILVLKQKSISFLHAWHHCLVIPYTWFWATSNQPWVLGGVVINTFVHTFMYYYYAVSLFGIRPWWKQHLTKLQIAQFAVGGPCAGLYLYYHFFGPGCTEVSTTLATGMFDVSLIVLFAHFYSHNYTAAARKRQNEGAELKTSATRLEEALKIVQERDARVGAEKKTK